MVLPSADSLINAGDVQSQAVYPLASFVARSPPDGNEEASGSPLINSLPENSSNTLPSEVGLINASCFSAVIPVIGWNQCVKCVAPFSIAQSFIAFATVSAIAGFNSVPNSMVFLSSL